MYTGRLKKIRNEMQRMDIDAYIVHRRDAHLNEYLHARYDQVKYLTGFTGSNGTLLVLQDKAYMYTDSRYYLQAEEELDSEVELVKIDDGARIAQKLSKIAQERGTAKIRVGINPEYITETEYEREYVPIQDSVEVVWDTEDIVDKVWTERPKMPHSKVEKMQNQEEANKKIEAVRACMVPEKHKRAVTKEVDSVIIADMDEIAWITNMRGKDVPMSRLFYAYMHVTHHEVKLYTDAEGMEEAGIEGMQVYKYKEFSKHIEELKDKRIGVTMSTNYAITKKLRENRNTVAKYTAMLEMKAVKTKDEIAGFVTANTKDAVYLCMLFGAIKQKIEQGEEVGEADAERMLLELKQHDSAFVIPSFDTISAYGKNGAVVHYSAKDNSTKIEDSSLYLIDSGSQYTMGTTDITRTVCFGTPTAKQKKHYTALVKGHIALERVRFVEGTKLGTLATLVRQEVWRVQENYKHATGHGVGYGLNVHEGPHYLEPLSRVVAEAGMVVTNEPGIYIEREYGIRHENLMVVEKDASAEGFLVLKNITPVPLHLALLETKMLRQEEAEHISRENEKIRSILEQGLAEHAEGMKWMKDNTEKVVGAYERREVQ